MFIRNTEIEKIRQALKKNDVRAVENMLTEIESRNQSKHYAYVKKQRENGLTLKQKAQVERQRKLTDFELKSIKYLYNTGDYSMRDLGTKYGVSRQTILNVVKERLWYMKGENNNV